MPDLLTMRIILTVLLAALALVACDYPWWKFDNFKLEAQLRGDGSCSFSINGKLATDPQFQQQKVDSGGCVGCTSDQQDGYWISCSNEKPLHAPSLSILVVLPKGTIPQPGSYKISEVSGQAAYVTTTASVVAYKPSNLANGITGTNLVAVDGYLVVDKVVEIKAANKFETGNVSVVGHLGAKAQRRAAGF